MKDASNPHFFHLALAAPASSPRKERRLPALGSLGLNNLSRPSGLSRRAGSRSGDAPLYIYRWDRCGRKGQPCRVFARGTMNSVGLEFEDGFTMVTSGNALRRA